jgi:phenylacetate-CoA ligase
MARLAELDRNQWLSREKLLALQQEKLHRLLAYAYTFVPYYRRTFDQVGFRPDDILTDPIAFQKIPFLTKPLVRQNFDDLITTEKNRRNKLSRGSTSGSTGEPLVFLQDNNSRDSDSAYTNHFYMWSGWQFGQPHAHMYGTSFGLSKVGHLRAQLEHWAFNRFKTNAYALSEESMQAFAAKAMRRRPRLLYGNSSAFFHFAQFLRDHPAYDLRFVDAVYCTSEVLYPAQRQLIEDTFDCRVFSLYGAWELGVLGCECEAHAGLHVAVENAYIEILKDGTPTEPGEAGDIFVTNLNNYGMPFIRYQLADVVAWHPDERCPCGRAHPMLKSVEGRSNDLFRSRDGRIVGSGGGGIGNPLWDMEGVRKFQFIQKTLDYVVVRIVKDGPMSQAQRAVVERAVRAALGDHVKLDFEFPEDIPIERSGKHRYQICELDQFPT